MIHEKIDFIGSHDNLIAGDLYRPATPDPQKNALLVHGGGQTRHSWGGTARKLAENGWTAIIVDQRGHGDSDWHADGEYEFTAFANDLSAIAEQIRQRFGSAPVSIGASLGGIASMLAQGETDKVVLSALVLVDITPRIKQEGVEKILGFMSKNAEQGFASLEEAADAISAYLPHRPRPKNLNGLAKNLRKHEDGRYRWHWDPRFISQKDPASADAWQERERRLSKAAAGLHIPVLLVRGQQSELVEKSEVDEFLKLVPHASYTDVSDAGHMIAGDKNDVFTDAVLGFLKTV
ncbi:MAG: alpha/beta fold hydrolase [Gammaproteobacteria bacterium]|nr:alpha/beta fold hydrolase [Gammaproteobacteria bacterium]